MLRREEGFNKRDLVVAKNHIQIATFFSLVNDAFSFVGASRKLHNWTNEVVEALWNNEISTNGGLNKEMNLNGLRDTRCNSHYDAVANFIHMFSFVIDVLEDIVKDGLYSEQRAKANILIHLL